MSSQRSFVERINDWLDRYMPNQQTLRQQKYLRIFGERLFHPALWKLNRYSVAGGLSAGLFVAFIPFPGQTFVATAAAIGFRVHLPLTLAISCITNPITIPPIFYSTYKIGTWMLNMPPYDIAFEPSIEWLIAQFGVIGLPLVVGSLSTGFVLATALYITVLLLWQKDHALIPVEKIIPADRVLPKDSDQNRSSA